MRRLTVLAVALLFGGCQWAFGLHQVSPPDGPEPDAAVPPTLWKSVVAGTLHSCGIHLDQTLWCWGRNESGQLGLGPDVVEADVPTQVGSELWLEVSASLAHTCAIKADHTLWCWGDNTYGVLGSGSGASTKVPTAVVGGQTWATATTGFTNTCAIDMSMGLWCWGNNDQGNLGIGMLGGPAQLTPIQPMGGGTWSALAAGYETVCGVQTNGTLWCWGYDAYGTAASASAVDLLVPTQVGTEMYRAVSLSYETGCAVRADGHLRCWGDGSAGELGNDDTMSSYLPVAVAMDDATWTAVAVGGAHVCGIHDDGTLLCWGTNTTGQLASDTSPDRQRTNPTAVAGGPWTSVATGESHTCAIAADHRLWCAGSDSGALGVAGGGSRTVPVEVGTAATIAAGGYTTCSISSSNALACWGYNNAGMIGDGTAHNAQSAVPVAGTWRAVAPYIDHTCGITMADAISCWGTNIYGELGNGMPAGMPANSLTPAPVALAGPWSAVASGSASCAIKSGALYCWGYDGYDNAGQPTTTSVTTPSLLPGSGWTEVAAADVHSCAIDGTGVHCWGDNGSGELGVASPLTPTPAASVLTGTMFKGLTAGGAHSCASADGQYFCWGSDLHGQLGNESTTGVGPFPITGAWAQLAAGSEFTCGVKVDGTLWCWGANDWGQLGIGTRVERHEPRQVGTDTDWSAVAAGVNHACALKTSGRAFCWGRSLEGEIGDGRAWRTAMAVVF